MKGRVYVQVAYVSSAEIRQARADVVSLYERQNVADVAAQAGVAAEMVMTERFRSGDGWMLRASVRA